MKHSEAAQNTSHLPNYPENPWIKNYVDHASTSFSLFFILVCAASRWLGELWQKVFSLCHSEESCSCRCLEGQQVMCFTAAAKSAKLFFQWGKACLHCRVVMQQHLAHSIHPTVHARQSCTGCLHNFHVRALATWHRVVNLGRSSQSDESVVPKPRGSVAAQRSCLLQMWPASKTSRNKSYICKQRNEISGSLRWSLHLPHGQACCSFHSRVL